MAAAKAAEAAAPANTQPASPPPVADQPKSPKTTSPRVNPALYGFIDAQFSRTDAPKPTRDSSTFELRRACVGARGEVLPNVGYNLLFDGADTSLKDAYGALKNLGFLPGVEIRFGQWKTPFGYEQQESDTKLLWVNSSYVVQALARSTSTTSLTANSDSRDLGVGLLAKRRAGALGAELAGSLVNGAGPNRRDDRDTKNGWGRAGLTFQAGGRGDPSRGRLLRRRPAARRDRREQPLRRRGDARGRHLLLVRDLRRRRGPSPTGR